MSFAYLVIYKGQPENPDAFLRYYIDRHIPIVWTFPKIQAIQIHRDVDGGEFFMITRLIFDNLEDLRAAITSEQRECARTDMQNFPPFCGNVHRQTVEILEMSRG